MKLAAGTDTTGLDIFANFDFDNDNSDFNVKNLDADESGNIYMYEIKVTLTDSEGKKTVVMGTRGK